VYSTGKLEIGGSIGTLTMTNCDLVQSSSGIASFEFDAAGGDQIAINGGTATIGGTCQFATVAFTPVQGMGQDWDFIRADSVTYTASDNMTNLMGSYGLVLGGDYSYGVVDEGAVQALRLRIFGPKGTLILIW